MEDENEIDDTFKIEDYLRNLILLHIQTTKIEQLKKEPIKDPNSPLYCYLVNKDIIDNYLNNDISKKIFNDIKQQKVDISNYANFKNNINKEIGKIIDINKFKIRKLVLDLIISETLKIDNIEYPFNFFIIERDIFQHLFKKNLFDLSEFKLYNVLIGKEGIFIINQDPTINKLIIYYLDDINENEFKIDKIFIFNNINDFHKELDVIREKGRDEYFKLRNILSESGKLNLIDDGVIIGKYINILRNENFVSKKSEEIENSQLQNSEIGNIERNIELSVTKKYLIGIFLRHILICFSQIKALKENLSIYLKIKSR